jgi:hypothetical protein
VGEDKDSSGQNKIFALTAFGHASEVRKPELEEAVSEHIKMHPDLASSRDHLILPYSGFR